MSLFISETMEHMKNYTGSMHFGGNIIVSGSVNADSTNYSGSTKFGDSSDDVHQFTGSLDVEGGLTQKKLDSTPFFSIIGTDFNGTGSNNICAITLADELGWPDGYYWEFAFKDSAENRPLRWTFYNSSGWKLITELQEKYFSVKVPTQITGSLGVTSDITGSNFKIAGTVTASSDHYFDSGSSVVLTSPDGTNWRLTVNDTGVISSSAL